MAEFKIKPGTLNTFYFLTDEVKVRPIDIDAEIFTRLDDARDYDWRRAAFEVVIQGVWQVPPNRSHATPHPLSAEDIFARAVSEADTGTATIIWPTITKGTSGGLQTNGSHNTGDTAISVDDGGGANFDVAEDAVITFPSGGGGGGVISAGDEDHYVVKSGASGSSGTINIAEPGLTKDVSDNKTITLKEGLPLSVYPAPDGAPDQRRTNKGSNELWRETKFVSDAVYKSDAHIWDSLSDLTKAI